MGGPRSALWAGGVAIVGLMLALGAAMGEIFADHALLHEARHVADAARMVVALQQGAHRNGPPAAAVLERHLPGVARVVAFDAGARVVWARDPALVGRVVADDAWLRRALTGQVTARLDTAGDLDVYVPLDASAGGWSVLRVSSKAGTLVSERRGLRAMAWSLGLAGGLVLWLGAVIVVERILRGQERQREVLASKLSATERLRAAGEIAAGVAHDLNNLFTVLEGHLFLLRERGGADTRSLDAMEGAVRDGTAAMRRLRQMVRREEEPFVPVDAGQLIREAAAMVEPLIKARAGIELRVESDGVGPVLGCPAELREVLVNLMLNAVDAMPQGGRLTAASYRRGRRVCLEVADTGVGMSAELRARVFDPFFTTKPNGTGLGLAVARGIVVRHGGEIRVESEPGRGSRFVVDLPATRDGLAAP